MGVVTTSLATCVVAICISPTHEPVSDEVDLVEVNHFYDEQGRHVLDQTIFYEWCPLQSRFNIRAWRLIKSPNQLPQRDWKRDEFVTKWRDGDTLRTVVAKSFRESWTQYDPELVEQQFLPKEHRKELCRRSTGAVAR